MYIPDNLIKNLTTANGPVLIYFRAGAPVYGFCYAATSLRVLDDARKKAGPPAVEHRINTL